MMRGAAWAVFAVAAMLADPSAGDPAKQKGAAQQGARAVSYVEPSEQLIVELYVRSVKESTEFYKQLGFEVIRGEPTFVELGWDKSRLYLEEIPGQPAPPPTLVANVRIMVSDVDRYWELAKKMELPVKRPIGDRYYGLRDFTVVSPDGIGLRFASKLEKKK